MLLQVYPTLPSILHPFVHVNSFVELGTQILIWLSLPHLSVLSLKTYVFLTLSILCLFLFFPVATVSSLSPTIYCRECRNDHYSG